MTTQQKDLIIGAMDNYSWDQVKFWCNSIKQSGFTGFKAMVVMNSDEDTVKRLMDEGFSVISFKQDEETKRYVYQSKIPVHVERFFHIWHILNDLAPESIPRYVITTDVRDVVFQKNPVEFIEQSLDSGSTWNMNNQPDLIISSEAIAYEHEEWGKGNLYQAFGAHFYNVMKSKKIYNVGVLAGRYEAMKSLCLMIFQMSLGRPIPIVDQAVFNFLVHESLPYSESMMKTTHADDWACQLGTTADPRKLEGFKPYLTEPLPVYDSANILVRNNFDKPYHIVHQYDRVPGWKEAIESKYG